MSRRRASCLGESGESGVAKVARWLAIIRRRFVDQSARASTQPALLPPLQKHRESCAVDPLLLLKAALLGVVEGLTEFLPVSSTGHLILAGALLDFNDARGKLFEIVIQSAAILAVVWEFRVRITSVLTRAWGAGHDPAARRLLVNVAIAFVPLAAIGLAIGKLLKTHLFNAPTVATTFILEIGRAHV